MTSETPKEVVSSIIEPETTDDGKVFIERKDLYELYVLNRDIMKSCGIGIFPKELNDIIEKASLIGYDSLKASQIQSKLDEYLRANTVTLGTS